ncbi:MAG: fasciclin domain-containing protein [Saprospiraceae bacterium]|nr:fasciclin domain-containing protein [Saprospiraceae bacterium]
MKLLLKNASLIVALLLTGFAVQAQTPTTKPATDNKATMKAKPAKKKVAAPGNTMVGGETMYTMKNIVENAVNSKAHTTLVAALKAAGLVETLQGKGPFTVFAPVNDAFENLPDGTVETLLKPESKATLTKILTYHVVAGKYDFQAISMMLKKGVSTLKTVSGGTLTFMMNGPRNIMVKDETGNTANITTYDVYQSNGIIHSIDAVLLPK